jgi:hypothetical protein
VKVKNKYHVQEVEKWITGLVQAKTIFGYYNYNAQEKAGEKDITEKVASWNWEIDLEEP